MGTSAWPLSRRCTSCAPVPEKPGALVSARMLPKARLLSIVTPQGVQTALLISDATTDNYRGGKWAK